jgi:signal transduction histidine kinase
MVNCGIKFLLSLPKQLALLATMGLTIFIGSLDFWTGRNFALSAFYLLPVCWGTWAAGRSAGIVLAAVNAGVWLIANRSPGLAYPHPLTPYWDTLMLLVFFLVVVFLLSAFQSAHFQLEETVSRRTAALISEIKERKRLEAAKLQSERLAAVGTMAAQVAHEVRNPLGAITLNLDLTYKEIDKLSLSNGHAPDEGRALVDEMRHEVRRIQRVIEDYLCFARLPRPQRQPVNLNKFLEQKVAFLGAELEKDKVRVRSHFDPALPEVNVDASQIWQAILNLIQNSCDAMPGGGELSIGTWRDGTRVLLRVSDTGKGISDELARHIFEPFFTSKPEGTGLGLALVQQIATEHGGHVEFESVQGKGSAFTVFLPIGGTTL